MQKNFKKVELIKKITCIIVICTVVTFPINDIAYFDVNYILMLYKNV